MDCPSCGLANPPEAARCDCGYDFTANQASDFPGWPANLAWGHKLAAFWSIYWPAWLGPFLVAIVFAGRQSVEMLGAKVPLVSIYSDLVFFLFQALLTGRLARKNYRAFRIYVVRDDGKLSRKLSWRESVVVWFWIFWPQFLFFIAGTLVLVLIRPMLGPEIIRQLSSVSRLVVILFIGPYAVDLALRIDHGTFRLQTYAIRYV